MFAELSHSLVKTTRGAAFSLDLRHENIRLRSSKEVIIYAIFIVEHENGMINE